jgi:flagellar biosynthesis protein FlhB
MAENSDQEKTEEATSQRREDYRRRGHVVQTKELASVLLLLGFACFIWLLGRFFLTQIFDSYRLAYTFISPGNMGKEALIPLFGKMSVSLFFVIAPIFLLAFVISAGSSILQIGFLFSEEALSPNLEKINPLAGLKRLFSWKSLVEGLKSILKLCVIGYTAYLVLKGAADTLPRIGFLAPGQMLEYLGSEMFRMILGMGGVLIFIAIMDYFFQRIQLEEQMKMTKQEIRDEVKTREGDPLIKARIRKIQKEVSQRRMMADVPKADVIITNPTHLAVALKYSPEKFAAPILLAKGQDQVALRIREIAMANNITIVENKPLARTIYKTLEIGQTIPRELFAAVAEVLAYVFKLKKKKLMR